MLAADLYTPVDDTLIPTGEITSVQGTPLDFTRAATLGSRIAELKGEPGGYDHNYVLRSGGKELALAARVTEPESGRVLEMFTTEPAVQLYTANFLDGTLKGKQGVVLQETASVLPRGPALSRLGQTSRSFRRPSCGPAQHIPRRRSTSSARDEGMHDVPVTSGAAAPAFL